MPYSIVHLHNLPHLLYIFAYTAIYRFLHATSSKPSKTLSRRFRRPQAQRPIRKTVPSSSCSVSRVLQHELLVSTRRCCDHRATQRPVVCTRTTHTCSTKRSDKAEEQDTSQLYTDAAALRGIGHPSSAVAGEAVVWSQTIKALVERGGLERSV